MDMLDRFVHRQNLDHLRKQLAWATDDMQRQRIVKLLTEEEAKEPPPRGSPSVG
jgi:hypothetical protein